MDRVRAGRRSSIHTECQDLDGDGSAPCTCVRWKQMLTVNVVQEVVRYVSTDIDAPTATPFNDEYPLNTNNKQCGPTRGS